MRKAHLPPEVTPKLLNAVFTAVIRFRPDRERAVRLRLEGRTYEAVAALMNTEQRPSGKSVNLAWVQRWCKRAEEILTAYLEEQEEKYLSENVRSRGHAFALDASLRPFGDPLYGLVEKVRRALEMAGHERVHTHPSGNRWKRRRVYLCPFCDHAISHEEVMYRNDGGHRNARIYRCSHCRKEVAAVEQIISWEAVIG